MWLLLRLITAIITGRHMEPGGGVYRDGDDRSLSAALQQRRAGTAAPSTVRTVKDLEQGSGGGEVPKLLHFKGLDPFLHLGVIVFSGVFLRKRCA